MLWFVSRKKLKIFFSFLNRQKMLFSHITMNSTSRNSLLDLLFGYFIWNVKDVSVWRWYISNFLGENSDVTIILNRGERILAHTLVFIVRCKTICSEIIEANGSKYLESWSHLSKNVVKSFLSYLYCGILDLELNTQDDFDAANYLRQLYPNLNIWKSYDNHIDETN